MLISLYSIIGMIKYIITSFLFHIMYFKALYLYSQYRTASKALLHEKVYWIMYEMLYNFQYITNKLDSICFKGRIMSFRAKRARQCLWCALASVVENTSFLLGRALCITGGLYYTWANAERENEIIMVWELLGKKKMDCIQDKQMECQLFHFIS